MRLAVTGGRGQLGREFCAFALQAGHDVISIDIQPPSAATAVVPNLVEATIDVTDFDALVGTVAGSDALVHLAAYPSPGNRPPHITFATNAVTSYNALCAAVELGIRKVCLASSINATGAAFSRRPHFDYFPLDEKHATYNEDPYSLSKWVGEAQADSIARRHAGMTIASLRLHRLVPDRASITSVMQASDPRFFKELWAYTTFEATSRAILASVGASWEGHEVFYIVAPQTAAAEETKALCDQYYPDVPLVGDLGGTKGLFNTEKAERLLAWTHDEGPGI